MSQKIKISFKKKVIAIANNSRSLSSEDKDSTCKSNFRCSKLPPTGIQKQYHDTSEFYLYCMNHVVCPCTIPGIIIEFSILYIIE